jgi:hypothetical protein
MIRRCRRLRQCSAVYCVNIALRQVSAKNKTFAKRCPGPLLYIYDTYDGSVYVYRYNHRVHLL